VEEKGALRHTFLPVLSIVIFIVAAIIHNHSIIDLQWYIILEIKSVVK
jgi:hypothetical protein